MDVKKVAVLAVAVLLLFFVISQPDQSAAMVNNILSMLQDAAESLISFMSNLFNG